MEQKRKFWNGLEEYNKTPEFRESLTKEFAEDLPVEETLSEESLSVKSSRRDFLKILGLGASAAALAACETPLKKAIPYVVKPQDVTPGKATWYATTCHGCAAACSLLVKTRDARPIKIEGNTNSTMSQGGVCATGQASLLSLYDGERFTKPMHGGKEQSWDEIDALIGGMAKGKNVRILTGSFASWLTYETYKNFVDQGSTGEVIIYDAVSYSAIRNANKKNFSLQDGVAPLYHFDRADVIVGFGADYLGTWLSPVEYTRDWAKGRNVDSKNPKMSRVIHFEANLSITGSNADLRIPMDVRNEGAAVVTLYNAIAKAKGKAPISGPEWQGPGNAISAAAEELVKAGGGKSLVVSGSNDVAIQEIVNGINDMLGNYKDGGTIEMKRPSMQVWSDDEGMAKLVDDMNAGKVDMLVMVDVNPAYDYGDSAKFIAGLKNVPNSIFMGLRENETSGLCKTIVPINHYLENWDLSSPAYDGVTFTQPLVRPIFKTRQHQDSILKWTEGSEDKTYVDVIKGFYKQTMFPFSGEKDFKTYWEKSIANGYVQMQMPDMPEEPPVADPNVAAAPVDGAAPETMEEADMGLMPKAFRSSAASAASKISSEASGMDYVLFSSVGLRDGRYSNNPWLQELPDPITKVVWDNVIQVPYQYSLDNNISDGDILELKVGGKSVKAPAVVVPGMGPKTFSIALGYGRSKAGATGNGIGQNAFGLVTRDGSFRYSGSGASITPTGETWDLGKTQYYMGYDVEQEWGPVGGVEGREANEERIDMHILKDTTLDEYKKNKKAGNENRDFVLHENTITLWDQHDKSGHHWKMVIDLNKCTGCGACVVSCHVENNVPMVGREEVRTRREMHWMRIDRYFKGNPGALDGTLQVAHQPVMCQHCDNAPCESVCPVLATVHSDEGLNQQAYNRCIGTRYCANNCPYKVRRFNWFSYYSNEKFRAVNGHMFEEADNVGRMVLNPDVVVRARGVMEKCSLCVQRIQDGKLKAKVAGRTLDIDEANDIQTACQQSCPAGAITFGDYNQEGTKITELWDSTRNFLSLEVVKTYPTVGYLTQVRNNKPSELPPTEKGESGGSEKAEPAAEEA